MQRNTRIGGEPLQKYLPYAVGLVGIAGFLYSVPSILKKCLEDDYFKIDTVTAEGASFVTTTGEEVPHDAEAARALPPDEEGDESHLTKKEKKKAKKNKNKGEGKCAVPLGDIEDIDKVCGFLRPKTKDLHESVEHYEKHIFVCSGKRDWPCKIEDDEKIGEIMKAFSAEKKLFPTKVKITACDLRSKNGGIDVLVFPDMLRFYDVRPGDVQVLFNFLNPNYDKSTGNVLKFSTIRGSYVFVCAHVTKDNRCGYPSTPRRKRSLLSLIFVIYCGPILIDEFNDKLAGRADVQVSAATHVGGHAFAGNVLIFPSGDWLGYVSPQNVPAIIDTHINKGEVIQELWRGRMGD